jgi:3',5'-cyclic AMP phosphodiesterase CpdA
MAVLAAAARAETPTIRIAVISDINGRYGSTDYHPRLQRAINRIIELQPDMVISTGDMVAGQRHAPKLSRRELESMWQSFQRHVSEPLDNAGIMLVMTPGNHDASAYPGFELERQVYRQYRPTPPAGLDLLPGHNYPFYYAFERDGILYVSLDATALGPLDEAQHLWLRSLPQSGSGKRATIAFGHLPLQPVGTGREQEIIRDRSLEQQLARLAPVAYLSGHHHAFYPGWRDGIRMLAVGNLGGNQRALTGTSIRTGFSFTWLEVSPAGEISVRAFTEQDFFGEVDIDRLPPRLGQGDDQLLREDLRR